jgi:hypothetical protein
VVDPTNTPEISLEGCRMTPDGRVALADAIRNLTHAKNAGNQWARLRKNFPEVKALVGFYRFPGPGRNPTPVISPAHLPWLAPRVLEGVRAQVSVHRQKRQKVVYFVQTAGGGLIKIGFTTNLEARVRDLQTSSPVALCVLATLSGGESLEAELHERFASYRKHGEWFEPAPELLSFVSSLRA